MKQAGPLWLAPGRPAAVLAVPGHLRPWPAGRPADRIARAFIIAAAKAGADALELDARHCTHKLVECARRHGLHTVARISEHDGIRRASDAGIKTFHVHAADIGDSVRPALTRAASCVIVSGPPNASDELEKLKGSGVEVLPLHSHDKLLKRLRGPSAMTEFPAGADLFGCDLSPGAAPASVGGVLVAAFGASLVRQRLAVARYFGGDGAPAFLSQKDFREMVRNIRAAERILRRPPADTPQPGSLSMLTRRKTGRGVFTAPDNINTNRTQVHPPTADGKRYAVVASELVTTVVVAIDLAAGPEVDTAAMDLLLTRLRRARAADRICAILSGSEPEEICDALTERAVEMHRLEESWLAGIVALADKSGADIVAWLPVENVLVDPDLLDQMVIQHVKSGADCTLCSHLPRGLSSKLISKAALQRIAAFTSGSADAPTVHKLLGNHKVFRVEEAAVENSPGEPDLDLTWHPTKKGLFDRTVQTGAESAAELIERFSELRGKEIGPSESEARYPLSSCSFITHGSDTTVTL